MEQDKNQKVEWFRKMLLAVSGIRYTRFSGSYDIQYIDKARTEEILTFFMLGNDAKSMELNYASQDNPKDYMGKSILKNNCLGLYWIAETQEEAGQITGIHILGPVFADEYSKKHIVQRLDGLKLSIASKHKFMKVIEEIPVITITKFLEYGMMFHYCITGEKLNFGDFYQNYSESREKKYKESIGVCQHNTYELERKMLTCVEEGSQDYKIYQNRLGHEGALGNIAEGTALHQYQVHEITFITLISRAAIRGGLHPEIAYAMSDHYLMQIDRCESLEELTEIGSYAIADFVARVHRLKSEEGISPKIQKVCDYINLHINSKLSIHELADFIGYSDYYLSRCFKQEMGVGLKEYIQDKKLNEACQLLKNTNLSVAEISEKLGFTAQSYFGDIFRRAMGISPGEYRNCSEKTIRIAKNQ